MVNNEKFLTFFIQRMGEWGHLGKNDYFKSNMKGEDTSEINANLRWKETCKAFTPCISHRSCWRVSYAPSYFFFIRSQKLILEVSNITISMKFGVKLTSFLVENCEE